MAKPQRKIHKKLQVRQDDYDSNYATEPGWHRPGSQNNKKGASAAFRKGKVR
jgi:hypothetical protein